jgi:hypothetical protein
MAHEWLNRAEPDTATPVIPEANGVREKTGCKNVKEQWKE